MSWIKNSDKNRDGKYFMIKTCWNFLNRLKMKFNIFIGINLQWPKSSFVNYENKLNIFNW